MATSMPDEKPLVIKEHHERILEALSRYHVMHAAQLNKLLYGGRSETRMYGLCRALATAQYTIQHDVHPQKRGGNSYIANFLGGKGRSYLKKRGMEVPKRLRLTDLAEHNPSILHTFAVNEILIHAERLPGRVPQVTLDTFLHEHTIAGSYGIKVSMPDNRSYTVKLDGFVSFTVEDERGVSTVGFGIEVDRATTTAKERIERKITAIVQAKRFGYYQHIFGHPLRLIITAPDIKRRRILMNWVGEALQKLEAEPELIAAFYFTDAPFDQMLPEEFFFSPVFYQLGDRSRVPLMAIAVPQANEQIDRLPN